MNLAFFVSQPEISGKEIKLLQSSKILQKSSQLDKFHLPISGKLFKLEHSQNIELIEDVLAVFHKEISSILSKAFIKHTGHPYYFRSIHFR